MRYLSNNRATIIFIALIFIVILSTIAAAIFIYMYGQTSVNYKEIQRLKTLYACKAATSYAWHCLRLGIIPTSPYVIHDTDNQAVSRVTINTPSNPDGSYNIICNASY